MTGPFKEKKKHSLAGNPYTICERVYVHFEPIEIGSSKDVNIAAVAKTRAAADSKSPDFWQLLLV